MRTFGTRGPVNPQDNYVVTRTAELADFIHRVKEGRHIVIFAPRQTGKTSFFRAALDILASEEPNYFPIELNFAEYEEFSASDFYEYLYRQIHKEIKHAFQKQGEEPSEALRRFLANVKITNHVLMRRFFEEFASLLNTPRVVRIIDEFDSIPPDAVKGFLH